MSLKTCPKCGYAFLSNTQKRILETLNQSEGKKMNGVMLAKSVGVSQPAITKGIQKLIVDGLVNAEISEYAKNVKVYSSAKVPIEVMQ